jgi:hypothetical protein
VDAFSLAEIRYALLASETFQDYSDLLLGREFAAGFAFNVPDDRFR